MNINLKQFLFGLVLPAFAIKIAILEVLGLLAKHDFDLIKIFTADPITYMLSIMLISVSVTWYFLFDYSYISERKGLIRYETGMKR